MTESARARARVRIPVLLICVVAWMMLLVKPGIMMPHAHRSVTDSEASLVSFHMWLTMNPLSSLAAGWALMLVAMMSPSLMAPVRHILERSFKRRYARSVMLFVMGYAVIWMAAGGVLLAAMLVLSRLAPHSYLPTVGVGLIAFVWQCSPIKQRCLNRGHNHRELAAFGIAADLDALRFGITHGVWCVGSCWALMLFPIMLSQGHLVAMAALTFVMISDRLEQPRPLSWRLRVPGKLMRIVVAQTQRLLAKKKCQEPYYCVMEK